MPFRIDVDGHFVICPDGRVGLTCGRTSGDRVRVKFGPDGPHSCYRDESLRHAKKDDVIEAGLHGVGGQWVDP